MEISKFAYSESRVTNFFYLCGSLWDEIISEETFCELLELSGDAVEEMSTDIMDEGWEDDDLEDDGLQFV